MLIFAGDTDHGPLDHGQLGGTTGLDGQKTTTTTVTGWLVFLADKVDQQRRWRPYGNGSREMKKCYDQGRNL